MEELLLAYNEKPFVSAQYKAGLDQIGVRADAMAADIPEELVALIETLGQDNVRRLSVTLLVDLLKLEQNAERAPELARDVAALGEDLLLAGDYRVGPDRDACTGRAGAHARRGCERRKPGRARRARRHVGVPRDG